MGLVPSRAASWSRSTACTARGQRDARGTGGGSALGRFCEGAPARARRGASSHDAVERCWSAMGSAVRCGRGVWRVALPRGDGDGSGRVEGVGFEIGDSAMGSFPFMRRPPRRRPGSGWRAPWCARRRSSGRAGGRFAGRRAAAGRRGAGGRGWRGRASRAPGR